MRHPRKRPRRRGASPCWLRLRASVELAKEAVHPNETPAAARRSICKKRQRGDVPSAAPAPAGVEVRSASAAAQGEERGSDAVAWHIDKSILPLSEPRRYRDREHLRFVSMQPCLVCGRRPSDAHHLRFMQPRALGPSSRRLRLQPVLRPLRRMAPGDHRDPCGRPRREAVRGLRRRYRAGVRRASPAIIGTSSAGLRRLTRRRA
jgi:hypothetical protein